MMVENQTKSSRWNRRDIFTGIACGAGVMLILTGLNDMMSLEFPSELITAGGAFLGATMAYLLSRLRIK